jgi:hypothetical protein
MMSQGRSSWVPTPDETNGGIDLSSLSRPTLGEGICLLLSLLIQMPISFRIILIDISRKNVLSVVLIVPSVVKLIFKINFHHICSEEVKLTLQEDVRKEVKMTRNLLI